MTEELRPWLSTLEQDSPLRALLESARVDEPSPEQLAALKARLEDVIDFDADPDGGDGGGEGGGDGGGGGDFPGGSTSPAAPSSAGAGAGAGSAGTASVLGAAKTWVLGSVTAAVVGAGAFQAGREYQKQQEPPPTVAVPVAAVQPAPPAVEPTPLPAVAPAPVAPRPVKPRSPELSFEAETALIEKAMGAAQMAQWQEALKHLSQHARVFSEGSLVQEREVLRVQALVELGRVEEAKERVTLFKARWPTSPHLRRLEGFLKPK